MEINKGEILSSSSFGFSDLFLLLHIASHDTSLCLCFNGTEASHAIRVVPNPGQCDITQMCNSSASCTGLTVSSITLSGTLQ